MLKFLKYSLIVFLISACSGESYDVSKAINILPDKTDNFTPDPSLKNTKIELGSNEYYFGTLERKKIAKLRNKLSNFEILEKEVCYIKTNLKLSCISFETKSITSEVLLFTKNSEIKTSNISSMLLTIWGEEAVAITNNGYIVKANLEEQKINWTAKIPDITTIKPFIYENKVFIFTASGASTVFNLENGEVLASVLKVDDPVGINFNLTENLNPIFIPQGNVLTSYYRSELMFFDIITGLKVFSISLSESSLDFIRITSDPVIFRNLIIAPTSENIAGILLTNGTKLWSLNADISSNLALLGGFTFFFDYKTKNIVSLFTQNGSVKWKAEFELPKKTTKLWLVPQGQKFLLAFDEKGILTKFNLENGEEIEEKKKQKFYSENFDYKLIKNKIYYTDGSNNLIILE